MDIYLTISSLLNFVVPLLLIGNVLSSKRRNHVARKFVYFLLAVAGWAGAYTLWRISEDAVAAEFFCRLLTAVSVFTSVTLYDFCLNLGGLRAPKSVLAGYLLGISVVILVMNGHVVDGVSAKYGHRFWPDADAFTAFYLLVYSVYLTLSAWILVVSCRRNLGGKVSDAVFVLFVCFIGFVAGSTNFPLWYDIPIQPYGNGLVAVYVLLLSLGLYENRYLKISVDFYRFFAGLAFNVGVAALFVIGLTVYRTAVGEQVEASTLLWEGLLAFGIASAAFWGLPRIKGRMEKIVDGILRKERRGLLSELKALPTEIPDIGEEKGIYQLAAERVIKAFDVMGVAVLRLESFSSYYECAHSEGSFTQREGELRLRADNPIIEGLSRKPECLVLDQIYEEMDPRYYKALVALRNEISVSVIVPIFANHEIYGVVLLGQTAQPRLWNDEETGVLFNIGAQIGLNLRTRDFERQAREVDKLVALGTMAAGLAHEIRNPLTSVQTLASVVQRGQSIDRMPDEFRDVLLRDIKRIGSIVEGVSLYSRNQRGKMERMAIEEAVAGSVDLYREVAREAGVELAFGRNGEEPLEVNGNYDQLVQVFNNLIENAVQAVGDVAEPRVEVDCRLRRSHRVGSPPWVEVSVSDNGPGIPVSLRNRIFDPFMTSKDTGERAEQKGMGLGLAISKRIIENHEGAITVHDRFGGGTRFVVSLRCVQTDSNNG